MWMWHHCRAGCEPAAWIVLTPKQREQTRGPMETAHSQAAVPLSPSSLCYIHFQQEAFFLLPLNNAVDSPPSSVAHVAKKGLRSAGQLLLQSWGRAKGLWEEAHSWIRTFLLWLNMIRDELSFPYHFVNSPSVVRAWNYLSRIRRRLLPERTNIKCLQCRNTIPIFLWSPNTQFDSSWIIDFFGVYIRQKK